EKNRPATFKHPWYSLAGDFVMFKDILTGRIEW
ncbi:Mpo1-like protein, partial [Alcanivorax sp.]